MASQHQFGRRSLPTPAPVAQARAPETNRAPPAAWDEADPELEAWKKARTFRWPWRQLSLMASLCFGVASLVLPGDINRMVDWLLYALAGASLYAGLGKRMGKRR